MRTSFYAILISFLVSLSCVLFTTLPLHLFVLPLILLLYRTSIAYVVLASFCTGAILDLVFLTPRFGFLGLSLALTSLALYDVKKYFFQQRAVTIFIMTFLFSAVYTQVQYLVAATCSLEMPKGEWIVDSLLMPLMDGAASWVLGYLFPLGYEFCKISFRLRVRND